MTSEFEMRGVVGTLQKVLRHVSVEKIPKREMECDQKALHEQITRDGNNVFIITGVAFLTQK